MNGLGLVGLQAENQESILPHTGLRRMNQVVLELDSSLAGGKHRKPLISEVVWQCCDGRAMHVWEMGLGCHEVRRMRQACFDRERR